MDIRKLIKFGNNSFVISLPKTWVVKSKLSKGSLIYLVESGNQLVISPQKVKKESEEKVVTLDFRDEPIETMRRKIIACYINNYKQMKILFSSNKAASDIRTIIQNLMALEVIEQNSNMIVAKDYLNMHDISVANLIRKSDTIIRTMLSDLNGSLKNDTCYQNTEMNENISARDMDINRITFLIMRYVKYVETDPEMKTEGSNYDYLCYYEMSQFLERIADEVKRAVRLLTQQKIPDKDDVLEAFVAVEKLYLNAMKTYYNKDREQAYKTATEKNPLLVKIRESAESYENNVTMQRVFEMQRRIVSIISSLLRLVYQ